MKKLHMNILLILEYYTDNINLISWPIYKYTPSKKSYALNDNKSKI